MHNEVSPVTFTHGIARGARAFAVSTSVDKIVEEMGEEIWFTRAFSYRDGNWGRQDIEESKIVSISSKKIDSGFKIYFLGIDGDITILSSGGILKEQISTAGLGEGDELGHGYVTRIREIGEHLYVCGTNGQIYKRISSGWIHIDEPFLGKDAPLTGDEDVDAEAIIASIDTELVFSDINGTGEQDIYVCGMNGLLVHWDGDQWRILKKLTDAHLNEIHVASKDEIWICGTKGVVLKGNAREGFQKIIADRQGVQFTSIHTFKGKTYLATYERLYTLEPDEETGQLEAKWIIPMFGLTPGLQDAYMLDSAEGVLWSFGSKDLAFTEDGKRWTRVEHPDNPKIGW